LARKILLADDSVTAQNMGRKILTDAGYEVVTVNNGSAALKKIAEQKPDLIVLDVYMPGYSGLEVCQRIKESKETARIPILLTVGKLEPFKPEEARKARADAYVVKPFEASELLVALTKLEDKIVPQAEPYKPGRFAKAIAAVERFHQSESEDFGDQDSGWKKRIKFPGNIPAEPQPLPEIPVRRNSILGLEDALPPVEPSRAFERPIPEGLPKDITAEEIEAITAAAAQFRDRDNGSPEPDLRQESSSAGHENSEGAEASPVTLAGAPQANDESDVRAEATSLSQESQPSAETTIAAQYASPSEEEQTADYQSSLEEDLSQVASVSREPVPAAEPEAAQPAAGDAEAEVVAALQNLSPAHDSGASETSIAHAVAPGTDTGEPRWIAEPVALDDHEATVVLEQEMQKAFAAFAAADDVGATFARNAGEDSASEYSEPVSMASAGAEAESGGPPDAAYANVAWESESMAAAAAEADEEISQAESASPSEMVNALDASASPDQPEEPTVSSSDIASPLPEGESVEANTASASGSTGEWQPVEASVPEAADVSSVPDDVPRTSEHDAAGEQVPDQTAAPAAAWENWGQIRDAVAASAGPSIEPVSASPNPDEQHESKPGAMAAAAGASSGSETDPAIASIVDSVLAELKPKLMQEIARKIRKDRKE
jgi:CheY-like chemotaxis protein